MRAEQAKLLCVALSIFALVAAPIALAGPSSPDAGQSAAKHKPEITRADLKKLTKKVAALQKSVQELSVNGPAGYSEKASTQALRAAIADWEKNTEAVSGRIADWEKNTEAVSGKIGLLEAPLGGVLNGVFPGNVQIVDGSVVGVDIGPEAITTDKIAAETIRGDDIFNGTITGGVTGDIAPTTITSANVNSSQIQIRGATTTCAGTHKATEITSAGNLNCSADLGSRDSITVSSGTAPNVSGVSTVVFAYAVLTGLGDLTGGVEGQRVTLIAAASTISVDDSAPFKLSALWLPTADDTLTLVKSGTSWYEVARSAN